jgi:hypothetical protein
MHYFLKRTFPRVLEFRIYVGVVSYSVELVAKIQNNKDNLFLEVKNFSTATFYNKNTF